MGSLEPANGEVPPKSLFDLWMGMTPDEWDKGFALSVRAHFKHQPGIEPAARMFGKSFFRLPSSLACS